MRVGIDIGGTWTRAGVLEHGTLIWSKRQRTSDMAPASGRGLIEALCELIGRALSRRTAEPPALKRIGIAVPGIIDRERSVVVRSVSLPALDGIALGRELTEQLNCPVTLVSDADAATWGEYSACEPRPERFIHLRLGSGIACGVLIEGGLVPLDQPRSTHAPTLVVDRSQTAKTCACGLSGCLETLASGRALAEFAYSIGLRASLNALAVQWDRDTCVPAQMTAVAEAVLTALMNLNDRFRPQRVAIGGGVLLGLPRLQEAILSLCTANDELRGKVYAARLGDYGGIIGAALLARRQHQG